MGEPKILTSFVTQEKTLYAPEMIFVSESLGAGEVITRATEQGIRHLIQKDAIHFDEELAVSKLMIESPASFLQNPLNAIVGLGPNAESLYTYQCEAHKHKRDFLAGLDVHLDRFVKTKGVREEALIAADEIFTNASKNSGQFYGKLNKGADYGKLSEGRIHFEVYVDMQRVLLICSDSFGLLNINNLLDKISTCYKKGVAGAIDHGVQGAGIGSFMIFNSCSSYYLGVEKGKKTIVACSFQTAPRARDKSELSKNIHFLSI